MPSLSSRAPLFGALLLYFVLTLALIARVPWGAAPDEAAHAQYIEAIAATRKLPVFAGQAPPNPGYEFHQPPLFYLIAAPLWAATPAGVQNYAGRALSLVFGLLTICVVWHAANLLFGRGSRASSLCTFGAALSPLHQGIGAGVNNDGLAGLWSACLFYLVARAWLGEPTKRLIVLTGLVAGLGALTKLTAFPLGLWAFVAVGAALGKRGARPIPLLLPGLGIALLLAAPMLIRNQLLYGDPFAYGLFSRAATEGTPGFAFYAQNYGFTLFTYVRGMIWQLLMTAWGFFGGPNTASTLTGSFNARGPQMPDPLFLLPLLVVVAVPLLAIWNARNGVEEGAFVANAPTRNDIIQARDNPRLTVSLWWAVGVSLLVLLWMNFAFGHISGGQARYLHGALLPLTLLVGGGLARTRSGILAACVLGLVMLGMTLANIFVWKTLV